VIGVVSVIDGASLPDRKRAVNGRAGVVRDLDQAQGAVGAGRQGHRDAVTASVPPAVAKVKARLVAPRPGPASAGSAIAHRWDSGDSR
jgi:hypothetical protein